MKKVYISLAFLAISSNTLQGMDAKISGAVETFNKIGFNNAPMNVKEGRYPTDTFGTLIARVQVDGDFLTKEQKESGQSFTGGIGFLAGGIIYDDTRRWGNVDFERNFHVKSGDSIAGTNYIITNGVLYNLYLQYQIQRPNADGTAEHIFTIKGGRYKSTAMFMSGFNQGFELDYRYKGLELWWFSSFGRGFAYSEWIYDFYARKKMNNTNYGIHVLKASYSFNSGFYISPFVYFSPDFYVAPIIEAKYDSNPGFNREGVRSVTRVIFMSSFNTPAASKQWAYQFLTGKEGHTLAILQQVDINNYYIGAGWYQNFGNGNAQIGTYGNGAIGPWDFWTNTVYNMSAVSNAVTKDAKTGYIYGGGQHGNFKWDILGRLTYSIRADEKAIPLNLYYTFNKHFRIWFKLEWQRVTTHAGFVFTTSSTLDIDASPFRIKKSITQDRSQAMIILTYGF
ncbi:outer membrane family protein [Helicobacter mustelae]|uniref:Putative outer membrane protein n=1 Tax=Helicobacter mustelae (strain ATCC 43772 / CCUG 25715 / CIP 103759 / LMG 18044 / NCTC 12198 / R85-136P) TaxID=679897 RepID=D3UH54_HELM1|nr:outer membrane family protein [Helicobacter mustelae]CBG39826.1 Putative outer membrane protein [Helicobacter mustelae 12198]SQH71336.1 outer membrane protein [Helicobacter mustelae]